MCYKKNYFNAFFILAFFFLVSCNDLNTAEQKAIEEEPVFVCEETAYTDLKGQSKDSLKIFLDLINFNGDLRIIPHDGYIPMDFVSNRLTITLDEDGNVSRSFCG